MIEQQGRVVKVRNGLAEVHLGGTTGCASCDAGRGCGAGIFGRLLKRKPVVLSLENTIDAKQDQPVMVGIPESVFLRLVTRLYLYPLLAGIAGAAAGYYYSVLGDFGSGSADMVTLLSGLVSGVTVLIWSGRGAREFPGRIIVHLLRVVEIQESCK
jgi:sigma-E factor negative regulatory protein RseC